MLINRILFIGLTLIVLCSCNEEEEKTSIQNFNQEKSELSPNFSLIYEDSIGYGSRGMEYFQGSIYLSGIRGICFKIDMDFKLEILLNSLNDSLDFRDILVLGEKEFLTINSGSDLGFILHYKNDKIDTVFQSKEKGNFLNDLAIDSNGHLYCLGDPVKNNELYLLKSADSGKNWNRIYQNVKIGDKEFFFAASGSCMVLNRDTIHLAIGGNKSYVLSLFDQNKPAKIYETKISSGKSSGINAMILNEGELYCIGGDYSIPKDSSITFHKFGFEEVYSKTYGYQSTISKDKDLIVCSGRNGTYYSMNSGRNWVKFLDDEFYKIIAQNNLLYCSGPNGSIKIFEVSYDQY